MSDFFSTSMALAMIAAFLLAGAGAKLAWKSETRSRGLLMIGAAVVLIGNVLVWTL